MTHHHPDHAGALDFFDKEVPVYGHKNNQRWLTISDEFLETHNRFFLDYATKFGVAEELKNKLIHYRDEIRFLSERKLQDIWLRGMSFLDFQDGKQSRLLGMRKAIYPFTGKVTVHDCG